MRQREIGRQRRIIQHEALSQMPRVSVSAQAHCRDCCFQGRKTLRLGSWRMKMLLPWMAPGTWICPDDHVQLAAEVGMGASVGGSLTRAHGDVPRGVRMETCHAELRMATCQLRAACAWRRATQAAEVAMGASVAGSSRALRAGLCVLSPTCQALRAELCVLRFTCWTLHAGLCALSIVC